MRPIRKPINPPFIEENSGERLVQTTGLRISTTDRIRQMVRHELFRQQANAEAETFEEADDFDLPDGEEWVSPYEGDFDPPPSPADPKPAGAGSGAPPEGEPSNRDPVKPSAVEPSNGQTPPVAP